VTRINPIQITAAERTMPVSGTGKKESIAPTRAQTKSLVNSDSIRGQGT
jgi:hypothetical protein